MRKIWGQISRCDFVVFCFHYFWCDSLPWTMGNCPVGSSRGFCHFYLHKLLCRYNNATLVFLFSLLKLAFAKLLVTLYNKFRSGWDFQILLSVNFNNLLMNIFRPLEQNCFRAHVSKFLCLYCDLFLEFWGNIGILGDFTNISTISMSWLAVATYDFFNFDTKVA